MAVLPPSAAPEGAEAEAGAGHTDAEAVEDPRDEYGGPPSGFHYDTHNAGILGTAFRFHRTVWPSVLQSPGFWVFLVLHVVVWGSLNFEDHLRMRLGVMMHLVDIVVAFGRSVSLDLHNTQVITAVTTFFQVFYTSQCYNRYFALHRAINQAFRTSHKFAFDFKAYNYSLGRSYRRLAMRWVRASQLLFFLELTHGSIQSDDMRQMVDLGMLHEEERAWLAKFTSAQRQGHLLDWIARLTVIAAQRAEVYAPTYAARLIDDLQAMSEAQKRVVDFVRLPVPFQYFQILNMVVCINLALLAYAMALPKSGGGPILYFFVTSIFVGMLELAKSISDPFGDDEVDFPLHLWFQRYLENQLCSQEEEAPGLRDDFRELLAREARPRLRPEEVAAMIRTKRAGSQPGPPTRCVPGHTERNGYLLVPSSAREVLTSER